MYRCCFTCNICTLPQPEQEKDQHSSAGSWCAASFRYRTPVQAGWQPVTPPMCHGIAFTTSGPGHSSITDVAPSRMDTRDTRTTHHHHPCTPGDATDGQTRRVHCRCRKHLRPVRTDGDHLLPWTGSGSVDPCGNHYRRLDTTGSC